MCVSACHSHPPSPPTIVFSKVPPASVGGPDKTDIIEGRVTGAQPGQQIVLYAKSEGLWWVQPFSDRPFTKVEDGLKWKSETHLGSEYAAFLVDANYSPSETIEELPGMGTGIAAAAVVKGQGPQIAEDPPKLVHFSGYDWIVRTSGSYRGGSHNSFSPDNVWIDDSGALHLRTAPHIRTEPQNSDWISGEVKLSRSLGYGTYRFKVRDTTRLEPSAVLTFCDWDGAGTEQNRHELDIEISRWGLPKNDNAQYVVQPYYIPANIVRFSIPGGGLTHSLRWEPGQATFSTFTSTNDSAHARLINQHVFTSGVPAPGPDSVRISLYTMGKGQVPLKNPNEVVIEKFEYLP